MVYWNVESKTPPQSSFGNNLQRMTGGKNTANNLFSKAHLMPNVHDIGLQQILSLISHILLLFSDTSCTKKQSRTKCNT